MLIKKKFLFFLLFISFFNFLLYSSDFMLFEKLKMDEVLEQINKTCNTIPKFEGTVVIRYSNKFETANINKKVTTLSNKLCDYLVFFLLYLDLLNTKILDSTLNSSFIILNNNDESEKEEEYVEISLLSNFLYSQDVVKAIELFQNKFKDKNWIRIDKSGKKYKINLSHLFSYDEVLGNVNLTDEAKVFVYDLFYFIKEYLFDYDLKIKTVFFIHQMYDFDSAYEFFQKKVYKNFSSRLKHYTNVTFYLLLIPKNVEDLSLMFFDKKQEESVIIDKLFLKNVDFELRKLNNNKFIKLEEKNEKFSKNSHSLPRKYIYLDGNDGVVAFYPTGWIGDFMDVNVNFNYKDFGKSCIHIYYKPSNSGFKGWFSLVWQYPPNNWGDKQEKGVDLTGYKKLVFYARGEKGGEVISEMKVGGIDNIGGDTDLAWIGHIKLTPVWTKYEINLKGKNLSNIISGLVLVLTKQNCINGVNVYLSDIYYE